MKIDNDFLVFATLQDDQLSLISYAANHYAESSVCAHLIHGRNEDYKNIAIGIKFLIKICQRKRGRDLGIDLSTINE